jgi:hypothetical protein
MTLMQSTAHLPNPHPATRPARRTAEEDEALREFVRVRGVKNICKVSGDRGC